MFICLLIWSTALCCNASADRTAAVVASLAAELIDHIGTALRANLDQEAIFDLRQREIESRCTSRPSIHRSAEAGLCCNGAIDSDDECTLAPLFVNRIDVGAIEKDTILNGNRRQLTRADPQQCVFWLRSVVDL